jgi:hypothetical protein
MCGTLEYDQSHGFESEATDHEQCEPAAVEAEKKQLFLPNMHLTGERMKIVRASSLRVAELLANLDVKNCAAHGTMQTASTPAPYPPTHPPIQNGYQPLTGADRCTELYGMYIYTKPPIVS